MKAAVLNEVGTPLSIEEVRDPKPRAGEVLIKVAACGVCHSDLHVIKGEIAFPLPAVLGHEVSGIVLEVAPDVTSVKPGDGRVCPAGRAVAERGVHPGLRRADGVRCGAPPGGTCARPDGRRGWLRR